MKRIVVDIATQGQCYYACCDGGTCEHSNGPEYCGRADLDTEWNPNDPPPVDCPLPDVHEDGQSSGHISQQG